MAELLHDSKEDKEEAGFQAPYEVDLDQEQMVVETGLEPLSLS